MLSNRDNLLFGLLSLGVAVLVLGYLPLATQLTFDFTQQYIGFEAFYLVRWPQRLRLTYPLRELRYVGLRAPFLGKTRIVEVFTADGTQWTLDFSRMPEEAVAVAQQLQALAPAQTPPTTTSAALFATGQMQRQLQSWAAWLIIMGLFQMVVAQGFSSWGALLIVVGLSSLYFRTSAMFVVYALTIAWAGINNLFYGTGLWKGFALLQFFWAFSLFRQFRQFYQAETALLTPPSPTTPTAPDPELIPAPTVEPAAPALPTGLARAQAVFPWLALGSGLLGLLGLGSTIVVVLANAFLRLHLSAAPIGFLIEATIVAGLLGLATGLAGWLARYPRKLASIVGCFAGGLTLLLVIGFLVLVLILNA